MQREETARAPLRACVVIPCLDARATVADVIAGSLEFVETVIVVDDGSRDDTASVAASAGARVLRHETNRGKGAALLTGMREARARGFRHALTLDADGQHAPASIPALVEAASRHPHAIIIGARDFTVPNVPGSSKFGRRFSNFWVRTETGVDLADSQSGLRVYPVESTLALGVRPSRFEFEVEILVRGCWAGLEIVDVPVVASYPPRDQRISHYRGLADSALISLLHCRLFPQSLYYRLRPRRVLALHDGR